MGEGSKSSSKRKQVNDEPQTDNFASFIPDVARGMKKLDKSIYNVKVVLPAITCKSKSCGKFLSIFKNVLLKRPHFRKIIPDPSNEKECRIMLLDPSINSIDILSEKQRNLIDEECAIFCCEYSVLLSYQDFTFTEIIQSIIPEDVESINSFETIGHIAHINLKTHLEGFKYIIGEVLLDKNVHIKTVVNKTTSINTTFRFFEMELLAGEDKMLTSVSEHGCVFEFDYSKVYWNSRLQSEHKRLVDMMNPGDMVFDVFAGVGPFAIPAAKKQCCVFANDLNKVSYDALLHNSILNKVNKHIQAFNMDGRVFMNDHIIKNLPSYQEKSCKLHIIMNLPAIAPEFLDIFKYTLDSPIKLCSDILVHCYCFSKSDTPVNDAETVIGNILGLDISSHAKTHFVRRVAPNKVMLCVSFDLFWLKVNTVEKSMLSRKRCLNDEEDLKDVKRQVPII